MATAPTTPTAAPTAPDRADRATFSTRATTWADYQKNNLVPEMSALATNTYANALEASTAASTASAKALLTAADASATAADRVQTALDRAIADASALSASRLNLGAKTSAPTLDNQGSAILTGATYFDTTLAKWRVYSGSAWVDGLSAVAGVSSINGLSGAVTLSNTDFLIMAQGVI